MGKGCQALNSPTSATLSLYGAKRANKTPWGCSVAGPAARSVGSSRRRQHNDISTKARSIGRIAARRGRRTSASPMQNATLPARSPYSASSPTSRGNAPPHVELGHSRTPAAGVPLAFRGGMATTRKRKSPTKGRSASTKYGEGARKSVKSAVERQKAGTLKAGAGRHPKAKNSQASDRDRAIGSKKEGGQSPSQVAMTQGRKRSAQPYQLKANGNLSNRSTDDEA